VLSPEIITAITTTVSGVVGSSAMWAYFTRQTNARIRTEDERRREREELGAELRDRLAAAEARVAAAGEENEKLRERLLGLVEKTAALSVEVAYLRRENAELKEQVGDC